MRKVRLQSESCELHAHMAIPRSVRRLQSHLVQACGRWRYDRACAGWVQSQERASCENAAVRPQVLRAKVFFLVVRVAEAEHAPTSPRLGMRLECWNTRPIQERARIADSRWSRSVDLMVHLTCPCETRSH